MNIEIVNLTEKTLRDAPEWPNHPFSCNYCVYWEYPEECTDPATEQKEDMFAKKLGWLQRVTKAFGACVKVVYSDGEPIGYAQYAPPRYLPGSAGYAAGPPSDDAVFISCLFIAQAKFGRLGIGNQLLRSVIDELKKEKKRRAIETFARKGNPNNPSGEITKANLDQHADFLKEYFRKHVTIADARGPLAIRFAVVEYSEVRDGNVMLPFGLEGLEGVPDRLSFDYSVLFEEESGHRGLLIIEHNWATGTFANEAGISAVFSPSSRRQNLDIQSGGRLRGFLAVVRPGIEHIWMCLDHVVFLVALLLPAVLRRENGRWEPVDRWPALISVLKVVTAFTVAHTLTLSLAALGAA